MKALSEANFAIVGLGLMGGSLGAALKARRVCRAVRGMARRKVVIRRARELGAIDGGSTDLAEVVSGADVAVLATPVRATLELIPRLGELLGPGCVLLDLGSTKAQVVRAMEALPDWIEPIGGHPMAGREISGIEALDARLYEGATFVLTPLPRTSPETLGFAQELALAVGARPLVLTPERHDRLAAATSHLPYLASIALVGLAGEVAAEDPDFWKLTAGGFRDMSRLAASDIQMCLDILLTNREDILARMGGFAAQLARLRDALQNGDEARLREILAEAREIRRARYP